MKPDVLRAAAESIAGADEAARARARFAELAPSAPEDAIELASLIECAYPALARDIGARPRDVVAIARGTKQARDLRTYRKAALAQLGDMRDHEATRRALRVFAGREKLRIAARELLPHTGSDVDVTARELSDLADVCCDLALTEALGWAEGRWGVPTTSTGERCPFVVVGMGKLGGRELNAGSDVDLLLFYETDDGAVLKDGAASEQTLHEHFMRVAQRFVATLEDVTEDGFVWRVDLRLRPEGSKGPLVNALAAAERYYETWGRTWERAALVRARPIAGDIAFGARLLEALWPFVWRRSVDPRIADEMAQLLDRARIEAEHDVDRDLKLGPGGIREVEFFAQALQLVWGGREPAVRTTNTLDALRRLRARGYVTDREGREMADAYLTLRRLEHRIQFATGVQTHSIPEDGALVERIARSLGFASRSELARDLGRTRTIVGSRYASLRHPDAKADTELERLYAALDARDEEAVAAWWTARYGSGGPDLGRHLVRLARRPDAPLGAATRDKLAGFPQVLLEALSDAADPEQAVRLFAELFTRFLAPLQYARALAEEPRATRRVASLFGASAYLGASLVGHPELLDRLLFGRGAPTAESARAAIDEEVGALGADDQEDPHAFTGALRRAKGSVTMEVGLADLGGELGTRDCTLVLSALADATLDRACSFAMRERGIKTARGLAVLAMGKLGGREIGYGSDLDVIFVFDAPPDDHDSAERFARVAQRVLRLVGMPHDDGPGYELDTRLRPSGSHGLLVVSLDSFARYHAPTAEPSSVRGQGEAWERQALLKARFCAGDAELGARVLAVAHEVAYERGAAPAENVHHLRMRMQNELTRERLEVSPRRYDLKVGHGGLVDVEFAAQWLQMKFGADARVRTTDTESALASLEACGYLDPALALPLREGYRFLRRLEQRLRVLHGTSAQLIEEGAPGMTLLARRMGMRDGPRATATEALLTRYVEVTREVRAAYAAVLGIAG
jgi:glutamate-ammonia-ligase adenylyltransferase